LSLLHSELEKMEVTDWQVFSTYPSLHLFQIPPSTVSLPSPPSHHGFGLFTISPQLFRELLSFRYPVAISTTYVLTVHFCNEVNRHRLNKPWGFTNTIGFRWAALLHNTLLAAYSLWTFTNFSRSLLQSFGKPFLQHGVVGLTHAMCNIRTPTDSGNAIVSSFQTQSVLRSWQEHKLDMISSAPGLWQNGLAYYGFLFYLSKFYEVVDTGIILAKGKQSSLLQTYHHAGAMLCMWAGIRYMAPPIWLFVFLNSGIHSIMV
jgi:GNS1/SUR4 family